MCGIYAAAFESIRTEHVVSTLPILPIMCCSVCSVIVTLLEKHAHMLRSVMVCECCVDWKWMSHVRVICKYALSMLLERLIDFRMTAPSPQKKCYNFFNISRK